MVEVYAHEPAFDRGMLRVSEIHQLFYEQYGKPDGLPVVFLHGGPGGQTKPADTRFFNPATYRVVLFDQRGAGRSLPKGCLDDNTSHDLVDDIERLRTHLLGAEAGWHMVFGGSWGSTLALLYAQTHPERVGSLVLRGVWTVRKVEQAAFEMPTGPAAMLHPEAYERFIGHLPRMDRGDVAAGYHRLLMSEDAEAAKKAAYEWNRWGIVISSVHAETGLADMLKALDNDEWSLTHARFENHYSMLGAWLDEGQLLAEKNIVKMAHIPGKGVYVSRTGLTNLLTRGVQGRLFKGGTISSARRGQPGTYTKRGPRRVYTSSKTQGIVRR